MKNFKLVFVLFCLATAFANAQTTNPQLLVNIQKASQAEIDAYVSADLEIGMLVYNTDVNRIFEYTDTGFLQIITQADVSETVTILLDNGDGTFTYTSENNTETDFDSNSEVNQVVTAGNIIATHTNAGGTSTDILETVTTFVQDDTTTAADPTATGEITYTDEAGDPFTAQVVSADADNQIEVGTNGGAYLGPTVYTGFFIIDNTTLTATGTYAQPITGLPFEPSQVTFVAHPNVGSFDLNTDNDTGDNNTNLLENTYGTMNGFARAGATISQAVIFVGGSGNSINDISRYSNDAQCIGLRYTNNNGDNLGVISAEMDSFDAAGFTLDVTYTFGAVGAVGQQNDILDESVIVIYTAYK